MLPHRAHHAPYWCQHRVCRWVPAHWAALHLHTRQARGTIWGWPWGGGTCTDPPRGTDPSPSRTCRAACTRAPPSSPPAWAAGSVRPGVVQDREETTKTNIFKIFQVDIKLKLGEGPPAVPPVVGPEAAPALLPAPHPAPALALGPGQASIGHSSLVCIQQRLP